MTVVISPPMFLQFFNPNNSGAPLAGGKLFTYIAGTSTKQATWTDSTQTVQNSNPIILDSSGVALVWLDPALSYKFVLSPANDTDPPTSPIRTVDNIVGPINESVLTQILIGTILYPRSIAEIAAGVTPTNFFYPPNYVLRYGTNSAPGSTDMTSAINTAISVAQAGVEGRWVYFSPGTYLTTGITIINGQSIEFSGDGAILTTISNAPIFTLNPTDDIVFNRLYFTGNAGGVSNSQFGVYMRNTARTRVVNCHFENLSAAVWDENALTGLLTAAVQIPSQVSGCTIKNCFNGIFTQDDGASNFGEYLRIDNNTINDCQNWGILNHAGNTAIVCNSITGNGGGILIDSAGTINGDHGLIVGNTVNHSFRANLYIKNTLRSQIVSGNNFWACLSGNLGGGALASSFGCYIDTCSSIVFTNNVLGRNKTNLGTNALQYCVIAGNEFLTDPANTVDQWVENTAYGSPNFNFYGTNNFTGSFTSGGLVGNPNGDFVVGVTTGAATFTNGWTNLGGAFATAKYWQDSSNVVHLSGVLQSGTIGLSAFTLPATMRPADGTRVFAAFSNNAFGTLQVTTGGLVIPATGSNVSFSLDGASFRAGAVSA